MDTTINVRSDVGSEEADYVINLYSRKIIVPLNETLGVVRDTNVDTKTFRVDQYYNGIDLSGFQIRINIINGDGDRNIYMVEDPEVSGGYIRFEWTPDNFVTAAEGTVLMSVSFVRTVHGVVTHKVSTRSIGLKVSNGHCFEVMAIAQDPDIIWAIQAIKNSRFYIEDGDLIWERSDE